MMPPVVSWSWFDAHPGSVLADVRWYLDGRSGRDAYHSGHVRGAVFVDLERWLSGPTSPESGRHPLPEPQVFAQGMAELGIGDADRVLAYDDAGGVIAARLVWMLRVTGHQAALLDGGLATYPGELEQKPTLRPPAGFTAREWPAERLADIDDASDPAHVVLDARNADRFRGEQDPVDPRPGHIPGAANVPCRANLDETNRFLPVDELRRRFVRAGVTEDASIISYCGSGVTACHNLLSLELAGFGPGRLYPGSWSQYSHAIQRPVALGD